MTRIKLKGADEFDVFSKRARKVMCTLSRPGLCKSIKRKYNKRFRKAGKAYARDLV